VPAPDLPPVRLANNLKLIAHDDLGGQGKIGEGLAMKFGPDGRRYFFLAHENPPMWMSLLDVTDPLNMSLVWQMELPRDRMRGNSLALHGDTLITAFQVRQKGTQPAGMHVWDVADPTKPRQLSFFDTSGPESYGVHFVSMMDDRYAHIATGAPDFIPDHPADHQIYMIVDLEDREHPVEAGRWWIPGQRKGDREGPIERHPEPFDFAFRPHHTLCYPERPDRAYLGYIDGGVIILDISDMAHPKQISRLDYHPPFAGFTHTVVPLFERNLLVVSDEATSQLARGGDGEDWPKLVWLVDMRVEKNPVILSSVPVPEGWQELMKVGGWIGAHNLHENEPQEGTAKLQNTVLATWFSAGLRMYDIRNPFRPEEIAAFLPETPPGQRACRISDVFVDDRGLIFAADRDHGGLYVLEYTGDRTLD
jgi:hypothetical protein